MAVIAAPEPRVRVRAPGAAPVPYVPALDGLRALAVVAVLLYHAGVTWIPGGFLGVEVFFAISGYLITLLLVTEAERTGRVSLKHFWLRRARRLLPALFALLATVAVVWAFVVREQLDELRADLLASLLYVQNWHLIFSGQSYFDTFERPSPLTHVWSLAVEEQFYLTWPVLLLVVYVALARRRPQRAAGWLIAGAFASWLLLQVLYDPGSDPSRVYYGTDTRASSLLLGGALAMVWRPALSRRRQAGTGTLEGVGALGLAVLVLLHLHVTDQSTFLYRAGFLLCTLATLTVVAAVGTRATVLSKLIGLPPAVWVGKRSYGLYLWHWPVFVLTRPGLDVTWASNVVLAVRFGLTFLLAEISYRLVEKPVRSGRLSVWFRSLQGPPNRHVFHRRRVTVGWGVVAVGVLLPSVTVLALARPAADPIEESLQAGAEFVSSQGTLVAPSAPGDQTDVEVSSAPGSTAASLAGDAPAVSVTASALPDPTATTGAPVDTTVPSDPGAGTLPPAVTTTTAPPPPPVGTFAVGDSVMLGAAADLAALFGSDSYVDAEVGRQFMEGIDLMRFLRDSGRLGHTVVVHLGNNGTVGDNRVVEMMEVLKDVPVVLFLTVKVPKPWEAGVNALLFRDVPQYPNAHLLDWKSFADQNPGWFYGDGTHLQTEGRTAYATLIGEALTAARAGAATPEPAPAEPAPAEPATTVPVPAETAPVG